MIDITKQDEHFMKLAVEQAAIAEENGDVPIGCVIIHNGQIIGKAYNQREQLQDPTAHAEIIALTQAAAALETWRLTGCTIYVTLDPARCAQAHWSSQESTGSFTAAMILKPAQSKVFTKSCKMID